MKKNTKLLVLLFINMLVQAQTTFTFIGDGNWSDNTQWLDENYPGTTINIDDTVEVLGNIEIADNVIVTNNGNLESFSSANGQVPSISIFGSLVNNNIINLSRTQVTIKNEGAIITNGNSILTITDNSSIINDGRFTIFDGTVEITSSVSSIINNGSFSNRGIVNIFSGRFENESDGTNPNLTIVNNNGIFNITGGEIINRDDFRNNGAGIININRTFTNESTAIINNGGIITVSGFGNSIINSGNINNSKDIIIENFATLNSTANSIFISQGNGNVLVTEDGTITNSAQQFTIRDGILTNNGTIMNNSRISTGFLENTLTGELINNGSLINGFGATVENFGFFSGINTEHSGDFTNSASFSPGNSSDNTGVYKVDSFFSNFIQTSNGSLNIDLGGVIPGDNYDQLIVDRNVTLAGSLNVTLVDGFNPEIGDSFVIIDPVRSITGTFENVNLPILESGKKWDVVDYNSSNGLSISVIEDPTLSISTNSIKNNELIVYPNPTYSKVYFNKSQSSELLEVYNITGQLLKVTSLSQKNNSIDLSLFGKGIYFLKFKNELLKIIKK